VSTSVALLGPQRLAPTVGATFASLGVGPDAPIATVTTGWQEREPDDQELDEHLGGRTVNLELYRRAEQVFAADPEFRDGFHSRQVRLRRMQSLYRVRLDAALEAWHTLFAMPGVDAALVEARDIALEAVRDLDRRHLARVSEVHAEFDGRWRPGEREPLALERAMVSGLLAKVGGLAIAGGHVAVLLNRLRLFDVAEHTQRMPVVAWSAGAMACSDRVVLFHDDPAYGSGHPEAFENGLGLAPGLVPLPHARHRLRLHDRGRIAAAALRFAPATCVPMDENARVAWDGAGWRPDANSRRLDASGRVAEWEAA
jgi:hypothetical protein